MAKQKQLSPLQLVYAHNDFFGINTGLEWILFIQDRWNADFELARDEFDARLKAGEFTQITQFEANKITLKTTLQNLR